MEKKIYYITFWFEEDKHMLHIVDNALVKYMSAKVSQFGPHMNDP